MPLLIYKPIEATPTQFVDFWSRRYEYADEHLYDNNIGRELTEQRITDLFLWKNGMPLAGKKQVAVRRFIERVEELKQFQSDQNVDRPFETFRRGWGHLDNLLASLLAAVALSHLRSACTPRNGFHTNRSTRRNPVV